MRPFPVLVAAVGLWSSSAAAAAPPPPALPPVVARYEAMLAGSPGKGTAFDKVYQYALENGGLDALAARWRERAAAGGNGDDVFFLLDGLLAERRARPEDAREDYTRFTAAHPTDPRGWSALGELETSEGHAKEAADALGRALGPDMRPPVPAASRPALFRALARAQTRDFQTEEALATWRRLQAEFPEDATVLEEVGDALADVGAFDEARGTFERLRDLAKKNGDSFGRLTASLRLGQVEERRGKAAEAVTVYGEVVTGAKPGSWLEREARSRIESLYRGQEDLPGLADYYQKWLGDHPRDLDVAARRAAVLGELGRRPEAIDLLKEAAGWAPDRQDLQVELGRRLAEAGRPAEAVAVLEKLTASAPEEQSYWVLLGDARWQQAEEATTLPADERAKLRAGAVAVWRQLAPDDARDAGAVGRLAELFANHHLTTEALAENARAARLAPDLPDARERWAGYLASLNRPDEARTVLAGIVEGKNATAANFSRLANGLRRLDDAPDALAATDRGLEREPANFDLLSLRWLLLTEAKRWDEAVALYPRLLAAAPGRYFAEQVQVRHVAALAGAGRLDDTRRALAARLGGEPPLDEAELGLLVRMEFQAAEDPELPVAGRALAEGRERFPRSAALVRLEGERARRRRDTEGQVAALRRLIELQPAQRVDALRELARACQDGGRPAEALAAAGELLEASPANAASHLILADLLFEDGRPADAVVRLQTAVRLSDRPNDVRLRLARALTELGQEERARAVYDEAFEAAGDARERLQLMRPLTEAYLRAGKLDELIERFTRRQQAEGDGWRYALYLAEIYQGTDNLPAARRELGKALAARPKDATLLRQLIRMAGAEGNNAEGARYAAILAEVEPSDANGLGLVQALLENDQPTEAMAALRPRLAALVWTPGALDGLLPLLARHDLMAKVGDLLVEQFGADPGARGRLALALFQAMAGQSEKAVATLWAIFDGPGRDPAAPAPSAAPAPAKGLAVSPLYRLFSGGDANVDLRLTAAQETRQTGQGLLDGNLGTATGQVTFRGGARVTSAASLLGGTAAAPPGVDPADAARDSALVYLAALAVKERRAEGFPRELEQHLVARHAGAVDRLVAYAVVEAREALIREILAVSRGPEPEPGVDGFCLRRLLQLAMQNDGRTRRYSQEPALTEAETAEVVTAAETFFRRVSAADPADGASWNVARFAFYQGLGRREQADAAREQLLLAAERGGATPDQVVFGVSLLLMSEAQGGEPGDLSAEETARLRRIAAALAQGPAARPTAGTVGAREFGYLPMLLVQGESRAGRLSPADFAGVFTDLLTAWYPVSPGPNAGPANRPTPGRRGAPLNYNSGDPNALPGTSYFDPGALQTLQSAVNSIKSGDAGAERLDAIRARLDEQAAAFPEARRVYPRLTEVYLDAWTDRPGPALAVARQLAAENPADADLRRLSAALLAKAGQPGAAITVLEALPARPGDAGIALQWQILSLAKDAHDNEAAKRAALRLAALRLPLEERKRLVEELRGLGLTEKADAVLKSTVVVATGSNRGASGQNPAYERYQRLGQLKQAKDVAGTIALARNIVESVQLPGPGQSGRENENIFIHQAVETLREMKAFDAFIADTERQLAGDPDSARLLYVLATALSNVEEGRDRSGSRSSQAALPAGTPVWLRLTRTGEEVVGAFSRDGREWQELGRAKVALGAAPLVALAVVGDKDARVPCVANFDHVRPRALTTENQSLALPLPWQQSDVLPDPPPSPSAPALPNAYGRDGAFTLRGGAGGLLAGARDTARLVWRPLGEGTEAVALLSPFGAGQNAAGASAGLLLRADLSPDSPAAAVLAFANGGGVSFLHRDRRDPSITYWKKLIALRPREPAFPRALAARLLACGEPSAAVAIYDKILAADPDDTFTMRGEEVGNAYRAAGRFPEFVRRLLTWEPGPPSPNNPYRYNIENVFTRTAEQCVEAHQPGLVVDLCRRGLALSPEHDNPRLHQLLIQTLAGAGRREEAAEALAKYYCPAPASPDADPALTVNARPTLGFRPANPGTRSPRNGSPSWMAATSSDGEGNLTLPGLDLLDIARQNDLLPALLITCERRMAERAAAPADPGVPEDERRRTLAGLRALATILRIDTRDPRAEADLPAVLAPGKASRNGPYVYREPSEVILRMVIARRLRSWPGHEPLALEAFQAARRMADENRQSFSGNYRGLLLARQAMAQLQMGTPADAAATLREWAKSLAPAPTNGNRLDVREAEGCLRLMLQLPDCDADFLDLLARARRTEEGKKLAFNYDLERAVREGSAERYQPLAWLLDEGGNPDSADATLVYEIRPEHPRDKSEVPQFILSRGRSVAGSERERTLTFAYGRDEANFTPLGRLATAQTFGTWTGPIPPGAGFVRVSLEDPSAAGEANAPTGYRLRIVRAPNLLANPGFDGLATRDAGDTFSLPGWPALPAGFWRVTTATEGGPLPGRPFVQCEVDRERAVDGSDRSRNSEWREIAAAPVPLVPGREYFQSAWVRDTSLNSTAILARRYLDKDGKVLKTAETPNQTTLTWRRLSQRLSTRGEDGADAIPTGAASVVCFLKVKGPVEWGGVYLGAMD